MAILLTVMAIVLAIAMAVLFAPIAVDIRAQKSDDSPKIGVDTHLRWMGLAIPFGRASSSRPRVSHRRRAASNRRIGALLFSPGFLARSARLTADLAALVPPRHFELDARVGFEDPADTGMLLGWLTARSVIGTRYRIHVEPDFLNDVLAGRLRISWSTNVATVTWPVLKFVASPIVWRAVWNYRASG